MDNKLYWLGNSAKTQIINAILHRTNNHQNGKSLIFDYGCGAAGDWPIILSDHSNLTLIGYDPSEQSIQTAKERLKGLNAELFTGDELQKLTFKAHFIVSFSVLEHVYNRHLYLQTAKKHLDENGIFYLNYDDGHFRNFLDLNKPRLWLSQSRGWLNNLLAEAWVRTGNMSHFKKRVNRSDIDTLIAGTGFKVVQVFYSNLTSLKGMYKTIPQDRREDFSRLWLNIEDELNNRFLTESQRETFGDTANLWQFMGSRTLVLCHNESGTR
jgi:SAM-dependent methyltransferase